MGEFKVLQSIIIEDADALKPTVEEVDGKKGWRRRRFYWLGTGVS